MLVVSAHHEVMVRGDVEVVTMIVPLVSSLAESQTDSYISLLDA